MTSLCIWVTQAIVHLCIKFEVRQSLLQKICRVFRLTINLSDDLDLSPFDL